MSARKYIEGKLRRDQGPSPEARRAMMIAAEKVEWRGKCRVCGKELEGKPSELRMHVCEAV